MKGRFVLCSFVVISLANTQAYAHDVRKITKVIPQIAFGSDPNSGTYQTTITATNNSDTDQGKIRLHAPDGTLITGSLNGIVASEFNYVLARGGSLRLQSDDSGPLQVGYLILESASATSNLAVGAGYEYTLGGVRQLLSLPSAPMSSVWSTYVDSSTQESKRTGIALLNPHDFPIIIRVQLRSSSGMPVSNLAIHLPGNTQIARYFDQLGVDNFTGTAVLRAYESENRQALTVMMTLEQVGNSFATLPASDDAAAQERKITGTVRDSDGRPAVGQYVTVRLGDGKEEVAITGSDGRYKVLIP